MSGWVPARFYCQDSRWLVDWRYLGDDRFVDPFFDGTIEHAMSRPFTAMFWKETPADRLLEWAAESPGLEPAGMIFHMSRCGSTLVSQMLAATPANIAISEAGPIDSILRSPYRGRVSEADRLAWLRAVVSAYGQRRFETERFLFLKLDCWHIQDLPLFRTAFPRTPWVFLYRDPVEVLVSQFRQPGAWTLPGAIEPELIGIPIAELEGISREEYCARALATILRSALRFRQTESGLYLNYRELPEAVLDRILPHFGVDYSSQEIALMQEVAGMNAKTPALPFEHDAEAKQRQAGSRVRDLAVRRLMPLYEELERGGSKSVWDVGGSPEINVR